VQRGKPRFWPPLLEKSRRVLDSSQQKIAIVVVDPETGFE